MLPRALRPLLKIFLSKGSSVRAWGSILTSRCLDYRINSAPTKSSSTLPTAIVCPTRAASASSAPKATPSSEAAAAALRPAPPRLVIPAPAAPRSSSRAASASIGPEERSDYPSAGPRPSMTSETPSESSKMPILKLFKAQKNE